jgi:lipopolysaccharide export system protein LptA
MIKVYQAKTIFCALSMQVLLSTSSAFAQFDENASGPIDIQANEQEFAEDRVLAKGNVRVSFKGSLINGPVATVFRDPTGKPLRAIFTGHPNLTQGSNFIDADTLTFDMVNQKIIAEGNARSEVQGSQNGDTKGGGGKAGDKIITISQRQEYDKNTGRFDAVGRVKVIHGDIVVVADKLQLVYGADKKPETAIFTGNVTATQNQNSTRADTITYSLVTKRLQATGHVNSKVIQAKSNDSKKGGPLEGLPDKAGAQEKIAQTQAASSEANNSATAIATDLLSVMGVKQEEDPVVIISDSQDYSPENGRVTAEGNVRVRYQDTTGIGARVVMTRNSDGQAEKVLFVGRSQVTTPGKRWIADQIVMTIADKKVYAEGNTKAYILKQSPTKPTPSRPGDSKLATRNGTRNF